MKKRQSRVFAFNFRNAGYRLPLSFLPTRARFMINQTAFGQATEKLIKSASSAITGLIRIGAGVARPLILI